LKEGEQSKDGLFLEEMLELHETIAVTRTKDGLQSLKKSLRDQISILKGDLSNLFESDNYDSAPSLVVKLKYLTAAEDMISKAEYNLLRDHSLSTSA
jgi:DnaJ-domain-containing protein 1